MMMSDTSILPAGDRGRAAPPSANERDLSALFDHQPIETFEPGSAVFWEGDAAGHVFEVVSGALRIVRMLSDGRRVITGFVYAGDLLGVSLRNRYLYTAEAITRVTLRRFARNRFQEEINRSPDLRPLLFGRLCDEMAAAQDQMVLLARKSAEERVASFLLIIARRLGPDGAPARRVEIPMTRLDMADYLGLTIETVSRIMTRLFGRGVIAQSGRHAIVINDAALLESLAGEHDEDEDCLVSSHCTRQAVWPQ